MDATFSDSELAYLASHRLGRLATIGPDGAPQVVPVAYRFDPAEGTIDIGGPSMAASRKYRNVEADQRVAFVVDDTVPDEPGPFRPGVGRGVHIRGRAEALTGHQPPDLGTPPGFFSDEIIRIHPERHSSWHIDPATPTFPVYRRRSE